MHVTGKTEILGVIGDPIHHSMSPAMHNASIQSLGLDMIYVAFHVNSNNIKQALDGLKGLNIKGINVTVPHKESVIPHLDTIDPLAKKIGAVNTIVNENGTLAGYNTDGLGLIADLKTHVDTLPDSAAIIGAGGTAKALAFTLLANGVEQLILTNRTPKKAESLAKNLATHFPTKTISVVPLSDCDAKKCLHDVGLIIQTTSVGLHSSDSLFTDSSWVTSHQIAYDVIYTPSETTWLKQAKSQGAKTINGNGMLVHQGALAFEKFTGKKPNIKAMWSVFY